MSTLTPIDPAMDRGAIYAAASLDGQWTYQETPGTPLWAVTHVPTGRRYWVAGLDQARRETADGTAAARLELGKSPRPGKPMVQGEYGAVRDELSAWDLQQMLDYVRPHAADTVAGVLARLDLPADYLDHYTVAASCAAKVLGAVYSAAPGVWVDALRAVRPDLVPPHLDRQGAVV